MACNATIQLRGSLVIKDTGSSSCEPSGTGTNTLALKCGGYSTWDSTGDLTVSSPSAFIEPGVSRSLTEIYMLFLYTPSPLTLRIGGTYATLTGVGATFPTGFSGGETLITQVDSFGSVTTTFTSGAQTAAQVANEINASYALAGIAAVATVATSGQITLTGFLTGVSEGAVNVTGGTAQAALGFTSGSNDSALGGGSDLLVDGNFGPTEFSRTSAPARFELKGSATGVTIVAAGE